MNTYTIVIIVFVVIILFYQFVTKRKICPNCNQPLPKWRIPRSPKEIFWGGWTCKKCGSYVDVNIFGKPRLAINKDKCHGTTIGVILFSAPTVLGVASIAIAKIFRPENAMPLKTAADRFFVGLVTWGYPIALFGLPFVLLAVIFGTRLILKEGLWSTVGKVVLLILVFALGATGYILNILWSL